MGESAALHKLLGRAEGTIGEALEARARRSPDRTFLIWNDRRWTYGQAIEEVRRFAAFARAAAVDGRVAAYLSNSPRAMWVWLGTSYAGLEFVPVNRGHKGALLANMLGRSRAQLLVTEASALPELREAGQLPRTLLVDHPRGDCLVAEIYDDTIGAERLSAPVAKKPSDVACVMYTSGTTGRSKAVLVPHNQYVRGAARLVEAYDLREDDVFHNWLPLFHLGGQCHMTMTAIVCGGSVALFPTFSLSQFWDQVRSTNVSVLCGFSAILNMIWSLPSSPDDGQSSLRVGIFAGIPPDLGPRFEQRFAMKLGENYGMTEADPLTIPRAGVAPPPGSCGLAGPDFELAVVDDEDRVLPAGQLGEIVFRPTAPNVMMQGYEGDDAATLKSCRNLWFHTGDAGTMDKGGFLFFKGRKGDYIRRRGENVSIAELEALLAAHPDVAECAAVGVPSPLGEDDIKAVVVLRQGCAERPADLHAFWKERMARFMLPRYVAFAGALPRTDLGKVRRKDLVVPAGAVWDAELSADARKR